MVEIDLNYIDQLQRTVANQQQTLPPNALQQLIKTMPATSPASSELDEFGLPIGPSLTSLVDPKTGQLKPEFGHLRTAVQGIDPERIEGFRELRTDATRAGGTDSPWAILQRQRLEAEMGTAKGQAARQALSGTSQAMSGLAMRGGLSSGARTRLAAQAQKDLLGARQAVQRQGIISGLDIGSQDELNRQNQLQRLLGFSTDIARSNKALEANQAQYNLQNLLKDIERQDQFNMQKHQERLRAISANRLADATRAGGAGGGGFDLPRSGGAGGIPGLANTMINYTNPVTGMYNLVTDPLKQAGINLPKAPDIKLF